MDKDQAIRKVEPTDPVVTSDKLLKHLRESSRVYSETMEYLYHEYIQGNISKERCIYNMLALKR